MRMPDDNGGNVKTETAGGDVDKEKEAKERNRGK